MAADYSYEIKEFVEKQKNKFIIEIINNKELKDFKASVIHDIAKIVSSLITETFIHAWERSAEATKKS